ncbi:N-acetylmuramoyl-L-alanine amidase-like domain-containing protein [Jiulongibacter sp. NS-SX5]|uniref:N-acetylmuramoyl-L-alanine amidase-like domain-containing protein n=1 Tax=Jiulongibacter sp. NS-SX5 TaxID=3463854 RepID=UPI004058A8A0
MKKILSVSILLLSFFCLQAQEGSDELIVSLTSDLKSTNRSDKMVEIGKKFLGKPYLAFTLESPQEKLICRLDGFDCYTYVETLLALTHVSELENPSLEDFREFMTQLRYRDGYIDGYASRIHYFFEWAKHAEELELVKDLTPELGVLYDKPINFMSTHRQYYKAFKTNNTIWNEIKQMEEDLSDYKFYEIPGSQLASVSKKINTGDIIAFTSKINGLDVNHEGVAYWQDGELRFMHASSEFKKVVIADESIESYINRISKHRGLMVLRVL